MSATEFESVRTDAPMHDTRPMYWSIRREIWENRSLYVAPVIVACVALFASAVSTVRLPGRMRALGTLTEAQQRHQLSIPFDMMASMIILTTFFVGFFYCLDALTAERRDRSLLFWKSLPLSDRLTVLSKAAIPLLFLPAFAYVIALIAQVALLFVSSAVVAGSGSSVLLFWSRLNLFQGVFVMLYGIVVHALWFAPIYSWLLLVSAWARRAAIVWAMLPVATLLALERIASNTNHFASFIRYRLGGAMIEAFTVNAAKTHIDGVSHLAPLKFLATPGLWLGLLFAAACLAGAIRLRRNREPG